MRILRWAAHILRSFDCGRVALPTLDHISSGPPKIPYVRFSRVRLQASGTAKLRQGLPQSGRQVKASPAIPHPSQAFTLPVDHKPVAESRRFLCTAT